MTAAGDLGLLIAEIGGCRLCLDAARRPLPHVPRPVVVASTTARILIAGQAPGTKVHASGIPFNDASGDRLRDWMGVTREEFHDPSNFAILPMSFCFPGQDTKGSDLPPRPECAPTWRARLLALMPQIEFVLAIGGYAHRWHLEQRQRASLNETMLAWRGIFEATYMPKIMPLPHPSWRNTAWIRKNPWFEEELLPVLRAEIRSRMR